MLFGVEGQSSQQDRRYIARINGSPVFEYGFIVFPIPISISLSLSWQSFPVGLPNSQILAAGQLNIT